MFTQITKEDYVQKLQSHLAEARTEADKAARMMNQAAIPMRHNPLDVWAERVEILEAKLAELGAEPSAPAPVPTAAAWAAALTSTRPAPRCPMCGCTLELGRCVNCGVSLEEF